MIKERPGWQRLVVMLLCLVFVCAFYGSLTVQAVFGVDDIVIGGALVASAAVLTYITVVGLSGSDLAQPLYDAANRANTHINDFLEPKVTAFLQATDGTTLLDTQIKSLVGGLSYAKNGMLYFSDALGNFIHDFGQWLIDNGDITIAGSGDLSFPTLDGNVQIVSLVDPSDMLDYLLSVHPRGFVISSSVISQISSFFATYSGCAYVFKCTSSTGNYSGTSPLTIYAFPNYIVGSTVSIGSEIATRAWLTTRGSGSAGQAINITSVTVNNTNGGSRFLTNGTKAGEFYYYNNLNASSTGATNGLDVWNQDTTDGFAVDPSSVIGGSIGAADVPAGSIAGIGDYVQAIADAIAGIADVTLPVAGVGDIAIDPAIPADIAIPVTPAIPADRADAVPATGEATPAYPATGDYTLPLADFFPFCIPFDLYKMLSLLSASPEAPAFTWQFYAPGGETIPIEVDLSQFNTVASVLRAVETLAFCVGLGFVTKKLLFGS